MTFDYCNCVECQIISTMEIILAIVCPDNVKPVGLLFVYPLFRKFCKLGDFSEITCHEHIHQQSISSAKNAKIKGSHKIKDQRPSVNLQSNALQVPKLK